ncbi:MAG TPA: hypothetical protein VKP78_08720 [bacterium]|nr:hypothetical protein [bacterium]
MDKFSKVNRNVIKKVKKNKKNNDFAYWQKQTYSDRLKQLKKIREEYNRWKYGSQPGFQRVYSITKRT